MNKFLPLNKYTSKLSPFSSLFGFMYVINPGALVLFFLPGLVQQPHGGTTTTTTQSKLDTRKGLTK